MPLAAEGVDPEPCQPSRHGLRDSYQMGRRSDPERIFTAWRIATRNRLTDSSMDLETAERWCDAWVLEATGW